MTTKERDDEVDLGKLDVDPPHPSSHPSSDSGDNYTLRDQDDPEDSAETRDTVPWENRYEKLWVEVEKREVKSTFKSVAGELKARFGELFKSKESDTEDTEEEEDRAENASAEEMSSDEDEGEVIVRPTTRARRATMLLPIPEQRESGLEDSVTESAENSLCEQVFDGSKSPESVTPDVLEEEYRPSSTPPLEESNTDETSAFINATKPGLNMEHSSLFKDNTKSFEEEDEAENYNGCLEEAIPDFVETQAPRLSQRSISVTGVSDEELEEDMGRFKHEVGILKVVFLDLEKEKAQLQKEVEDGRLFLQ